MSDRYSSTYKKIKCVMFFLINISVYLFPVLLYAQSLSITDLINLQNSTLDKATGFFSYKGWSWQSADKNKSTFNRNGYVFTSDRVVWKYGNEEIQFLQNEGYHNILFYYTNLEGFNNLKHEIKNQAKYVTSKTLDNQLSTSYQKGEIEFSFNEKKVTEWFSTKVVYEIAVFNHQNIDRWIDKLCGYCKGYGEVMEFEQCYSCQGRGKKSCHSCQGKGKTLCRNFCTEGKKSCTRCIGQGDNQCSRCFGQGRLTKCQTCNGYGKINKDLFIGNTKVGNTYQTCAICNGRGTGDFECKECMGKGRLSCNNCSGKGTVLCSVCNGNYLYECKMCGGKGHSDLACSTCNGKGISNNKSKKVCPICEGSKLK